MSEVLGGKQEKRSGTVFCAGGSSRPNGSGYPLSVPALTPPPPPRLRGEGERAPPQILDLPALMY